MVEIGVKKEQKQGKDYPDEHEDDEDSLDLLTRARISFAVTEEVVEEPEVQSPAAEQAEEDEMKKYLGEVLKETDILRHTRLSNKIKYRFRNKDSSNVQKEKV